MRLNKGAMFGLDARIALAIFGALSVISGAALYSAIQQAKVIALVTEMNEVEKAVTAYLLDTGEYLPFSGRSPQDTYGFLGTDNLIKKVHSSSNAPYLSYEDFSTIASNTDIMKTPANYEVYVIARENSNWDDFVEATKACKKTSSSCSHFICFAKLDTSLAKSVEEYIDGAAPTGNTDDTGNSRLSAGASSSRICLKGSVYDPKQSKLS